MWVWLVLGGEFVVFALWIAACFVAGWIGRRRAERAVTDEAERILRDVDP